MARIGIFGGSFDPIHLGHLLLAQDAMDELHLDRVVFVPVKHSPLKKNNPEASDADRVAMVELAIADMPQFSVSDIEIVRDGISYTVDTLEALKDEFPDDTLVFLAGMDSLRTLHLWKEPLKILDMCEFVTYQRPGIDKACKPDELNLPLDLSEKLINNVMKGRLCEISSSEIRLRVAKNQNIRYLVYDSVAKYIADNGLYRTKE